MCQQGFMKYILAFFILTVCNIATAQQVGSTVSFPGADEKMHTGIITSIWFKHFKVKDDGSGFEYWLNLNQFTVGKNVIDTATNYGNKINSRETYHPKEAVLLTDSNIYKTINKSTSENVIDSKVSVSGSDGKTYTGIITDVDGDNYKVKYDDSDDEAWSDKSVFTVVNITNTLSRPLQVSLKKGDKVEFDMYGDGSKWERGTIIEISATKPDSCSIYKVKYLNTTRIYTFHRDCKMVRLLNVAPVKVNNTIRDTASEIKRLSSLDTLIAGEYYCYQAIWDYNTKSNGWESRGSLTLSANGTYQLKNNGNVGHYEWHTFNKEIKFHDDLEGAVAAPIIKGKNIEMRILFPTKPPTMWSCATHNNYD